MLTHVTSDLHNSGIKGAVEVKEKLQEPTPQMQLHSYYT